MSAATSRDERVEAALGTWWLALGVTPPASDRVADAMTERAAWKAMTAVVGVVEADVLRRVRASIEALPTEWTITDSDGLSHNEPMDADEFQSAVLAAVDAAGEEKP